MKSVQLIMGFVIALFMAVSTDCSAQRVRVIYEPAYRSGRPPCPGPDYVWVEGRWVWDDYYRRDVWAEGYWMLRETDFYCDRNCCNKHKHRYKKHKHGRGRR